MKKLINLLFILLSTAVYSQNEEVHSAKIIGSYEFGDKEVTTIYDEETECVRKTSPHSKNLFIPNESVHIKISANKQMAEVIKPSLSKKVYTNKNCEDGQQDCIEGLCIIKNNDNKLIIKYTENNYTIFYNASKKSNNSIKSNLIIYGGNNGNGAIPTSYLLDKSNPEQYKLTSHIRVLEESNKLSRHQGIHISNIEEGLVENLVLKTKTSSPLLVQSELAKSIYFHIAIIKSVKRANASNNSNCNCAPVPLYFNDDSPFICQEDLSYNISDLLNNLENNLSDLSQKYDSVTIEQLHSYLELKSLATDVVSFEEIYVDLSNGIAINLFNDYLDDFIQKANCLLGLGSDPGCCGNYSGCCWAWNPDCLAHDLICWKCDHWYCGWACVKG